MPTKETKLKDFQNREGLPRYSSIRLNTEMESLSEKQI